jgi:hypothetical protein
MKLLSFTAGGKVKQVLSVLVLEVLLLRVDFK